MIATARTLTPEQQRKPFAMGPGSVFGLLAHCCAAERLWLQMVDGPDPAAPFVPLDDVASIDALMVLWTEADAHWEAFLAKLTGAELGRAVARVREGKPLTTTLEDVLIHVTTHQMYHAAQFKNMLRQLGVTDQPLSDFIVFARETWSAAGGAGGGAAATAAAGRAPALTPDAQARRLSILGDELLVRLTAAQTGGTVSLFEQRTPVGGGVPPHLHEREDETFQILEGSVEFTVAGQVIVAHAGDSVWAPRGIRHAWRVIGDRPARLLFTATPSGLERMFEELATLPKGPPDFAKVAEICGRYGVRFG